MADPTDHIDNYDDAENDAPEADVKEDVEGKTAESEEDKKLQEVQDATASGDSKEAVDARSIYVGNVDYSTTEEELKLQFAGCGTVSRVTIRKDKASGRPMGYAYVEFAESYSVELALTLNDQAFKGRNIKVVAKRTNVPGQGRGGPGSRGRGGPAPYGRPRSPYFHPGYPPYHHPRPRGRGFRGYAPYPSYGYAPY